MPDPGALALATALREQGRLDEAAPRLRALLAADALAPAERAEALVQLGLCDLLGGRPDAAAAGFEAALALAPDHALARLNLGNAHGARGDHERARACYAATVERAPDLAVGWNNLGHALGALGRHAEAVAAFERALALDPDHRLALGNLRAALGKLGRQAEAEARLAASSAPGARLELIHALRERGARDRALEEARRLAGERPGAPEVLLALGLALGEAAHPEEAVGALRRAAALVPADAGGGGTPSAVWNALGGALMSTLRVAEGVAWFARAAAAAPNDLAAWSNRLLCLHYLDDVDPHALAAEHRAWAARAEGLAAQGEVGPAEPARVPATPRGPARPLRVAYLSPDLRAHPVASFFEPVLAAHDRDAVEPWCLACWPQEDAVTARLRGLAAGWRRVHDLDDAALARLVRAEGIDVLVDLAGHTGGNRLGVLARRPAPVQATWIGYPDTTGLACVDLRLTDALCDPPGPSDLLASERLARVGPPFLAFLPPPDAPRPAWVGLDAPDAFAFGSFNALPKLSPGTIALWSRVLRAAPGTRLLVKAHGLGDPAVRARLEGMFLAHGVTGDRLELVGRTGFREHLALYQRVGLGLDPVSYHGTTTTCEALWMGVPVACLAGDRHASRVGVSLMSAVGLPELVADTPDAFVAVCAGLARDPARLADLKAGLRDRMERSPLCDAERLAREVEAAYREAARARGVV